MTPYLALILLAAVSGGGRKDRMPIELRAIAMEVTVDANGKKLGCSVIEASGLKSLDSVACTFELLEGIDMRKQKEGITLPGPSPVIGADGKPVGTRRRVYSAAVHYADGRGEGVRAPAAMAEAAFARTYTDGRRGALLVEMIRKEDGMKTCAIFAPRTVSRFDPALCARATPSTETAAAGSGGLSWRNAAFAPGDL